MASTVKYPLDPLDTSLLNHSGSHNKSKTSKSKSIGNSDFSFYLKSVINQLDKAQNAAISSVGGYLKNTSPTNIDSLIGQINEVNGSLKDILFIRAQMMQAYQDTNSSGVRG